MIGDVLELLDLTDKRAISSTGFRGDEAAALPGEDAGPIRPS